VSGAATARVLETRTAVSAGPAFSPFEKDQSKRRFEEKAVVAMPVAAPVVPIAAPMPVPVAVPTPVSVPVPAEMVLTDGDARGAELVEVGDVAEAAVTVSPLAMVAEKDATEEEMRPDLQPSSLHSAEALQKAAVDALMAAKNQDTPADALSDADWVVVDGELRVQTELSKTMLPMVINAEAEKIVKAALRESGAGALKLVLLPGAKKASGEKKARAPRSGSAQAKAMEHPVVQRAQTLFNAEIRSVIDLRDGE
jgi:DNA polymerase-3 subunit gamma/tau